MFSAKKKHINISLLLLFIFRYWSIYNIIIFIFYSIDIILKFNTAVFGKGIFLIDKKEII